MIPVLVSWGPFHLYSYGLSVAVGVLLSVFLMQRYAARTGFPTAAEVQDLVFASLIWGFAGARLFYVGQNFSYYAAHPLKIFAVWEGGLIFYGGALTGVFGFWVTLRKNKMPFWKSLDFIIPYLPLAHVFGRIGCFLNGCCYGKICDLPWAVRFPQVAEKVHPTQLYEALFDLGLFIFLVAKRKRVLFDGQIALLYFLLYGFGRYVVEFLREPTWLWMGLTFNQWLSVAIIVAATVLFKIKQRQAVK